MSTNQQDAVNEWRSVRVQVPLLTIAFFLLVGFQTFQLVQDRTALLRARAAQDLPIQQSAKLRQQLDAIAAGTVRLADAGDADARAIVEGMQRQGITMRAPAGQ